MTYDMIYDIIHDMAYDDMIWHDIWCDIRHDIWHYIWHDIHSTIAIVQWHLKLYRQLKLRKRTLKTAHKWNHGTTQCIYEENSEYVCFWMMLEHF